MTRHRHTWDVHFLDAHFTGCACGALRKQEDPEINADNTVNHFRRSTITEANGRTRHYIGTRSVSVTTYYDTFKEGQPWPPATT